MFELLFCGFGISQSPEKAVCSVTTVKTPNFAPYYCGVYRSKELRLFFQYILPLKVHVSRSTASGEPELQLPQAAK